MSVIISIPSKLGTLALSAPLEIEYWIFDVDGDLFYYDSISDEKYEKYIDKYL